MKNANLYLLLHETLGKRVKMLKVSIKDIRTTSITSNDVFILNFRVSVAALEQVKFCWDVIVHLLIYIWFERKKNKFE